MSAELRQLVFVAGRWARTDRLSRWVAAASVLPDPPEHSGARQHNFDALRGQPPVHFRNCSDLRGSADYWAHCGGATEHGISTANRFRPLKREQLLTFVQR